MFDLEATIPNLLHGVIDNDGLVSVEAGDLRELYAKAVDAPVERAYMKEAHEEEIDALRAENSRLEDELADVRSLLATVASELAALKAEGA